MEGQIQQPRRHFPERITQSWWGILHQQPAPAAPSGTDGTASWVRPGRPVVRAMLVMPRWLLLEACTQTSGWAGSLRQQLHASQCEHRSRVCSSVVTAVSSSAWWSDQVALSACSCATAHRSSSTSAQGWRYLATVKRFGNLSRKGVGQGPGEWGGWVGWVLARAKGSAPQPV